MKTTFRKTLYILVSGMLLFSSCEEDTNISPVTVNADAGDYVVTLNVSDFVSEECLKNEIKAYHKTKQHSLTEIREKLDQKYTYTEIRFALSGYFAGLNEKEK